MNGPVPLPDAVAEARARHWLLITWVRQWGRANGIVFDPDLVALVLAAATGWHTPRSVDAWTRRSVHHVLSCDVPNWCSMNRCLWPEGVPETVWGWLHFLDATGGLTDADEPLSDLLKPLLCYGGLDFQGRPRPENSAPLITCECYQPRQPGELEALGLGENSPVEDEPGE